MLERCFENLYHYQNISNEDWRNLLEVDVEDIETRYSSKAMILSYYERLPVKIREVLALYSGDKNIQELIEQEDQELYVLIETCIKLQAFLSGKVEAVKRRYLESKHTIEDLTIINSYPKNSREMILCLLITDDHLKSLLDIFYLCMANAFSYTEYEMAIELAGITDAVQREEAVIQLEDGFVVSDVNIEAIDTVLRQFETEQETNFNIKCQYVISLDNEIVLFVLREDTRKSIRKIDELLVDTSADWTVIRFYNNLKRVKIRSNVKDIDKLLTKTLGSFEVPRFFFYIASNKTTTKWDLTKFFVRVLNSKISNVRLLELKTSPASTIGVPSILIRRESEIELKETLDSMRNDGFKLLKSTDEIEYLKVEFTEHTVTHIYQLKFNSVVNVNSKYVQFSGKGGSLPKRRRFLELLESMHIKANEGQVKG